jgi:hypothetical protein
VIEPYAIDVCEASTVGGAHVALLAADGSFTTLEAGTLAGVEPAALNALPDALLLVCASLVDGGVAMHGCGCRCLHGSGLSKSNGGS